MGIVAGFRRVATSIRSSATTDPIERIRRTGFFRADDIQLVHNTYFSGVGPAPGGPWDVFRDAHMELPSWFEPGLDPYSIEYARQQHRLWRLVAGVDRDYEVEVDEKEADWGEVDAVRHPGYYVRRDPGAVSAASDHVIATGMMLKHCGLKPGDWALEYGAGFAQTALALARLGVNVDTVDVSDRFCGWVREQAEFFRVPLTPFKGRFGDAPRTEQKYQVVWFYESFHHCLDFATVVRELPKLLAPGGRVILSGEPIVEREYAAVPYPWGLRLHSEVVAVVRRQRWFELGFSEDFLFELFAHAGFTMQRIECEPSMFGRMYVCHYRPAQVPLDRQWMPQGIAEGWRPTVGATDRQVTGEADWPIEQRDEAREIEVRLRTSRKAPQVVNARCGGYEIALDVPPGRPVDVRLAIPPGATTLQIKCRDAGVRSLLRRFGWGGGSDGVVVESIREVPGE
jgi:SAM-dependent methyltransferase